MSPVNAADEIVTSTAPSTECSLGLPGFQNAFSFLAVKNPEQTAVPSFPRAKERARCEPHVISPEVFVLAKRVKD